MIGSKLSKDTSALGAPWIPPSVWWTWRRAAAAEALKAGELVRSVSFSRDGKLVAADSGKEGIRVWEAASGKQGGADAARSASV